MGAHYCQHRVELQMLGIKLNGSHLRVIACQDQIQVCVKRTVPGAMMYHVVSNVCCGATMYHVVSNVC